MRTPADKKKLTDTACLVKESKAFKDLPLDKDTIEKINELKFALPIIYLMAFQGAKQSTLDIQGAEILPIIPSETRVSKCYPYQVLLKDFNLVRGLTTDHHIMSEAKELDLFYIMHLTNIFIGKDHVALEMEKYDMDFRTYIRKHRDYRHLPRLLIEVAKGLKELHHMGYIHRDVKPENIVIRLRPLQARLIDFNCAMRKEQNTTGINLGTPGYTPKREIYRDGDPSFDIFALGAVIMEADMDYDEYIRVNTSNMTEKKAEEYIALRDTHKSLKTIVKGTLLRGKNFALMSLDDIIKELEQASFKKAW